MQTRPIEFLGAAGQRLSARLDLPDGEPVGFALFAHCFTCSKSSLATVRIARALARRGLGVVRFDFTGLGESAGEFAAATFSSDVRDLAAVARQMADQGMAPELLVGHSLGGAAVVAAAADVPSAQALAVIGAPFHPQHLEGLLGGGLEKIMQAGEAEVDLGGRPFRIRRAFIEDLQAQDQGARLAALHRPLLILHSPEDRVVEIGNATQIFMAARHPKSFVSLAGADHLLTRPEDAAYAADVIAAWASRYLPASQETAEALASGVARADARGVEGFQVTIRTHDLRFTADEPADLGGSEAGPTPYALVAAGLAACTAMTVRMYAARKAWPLARVQVRVEHSKAAGRTPQDIFRRELAIEGELDVEQRARLLEIAGKCPVHRTLEGGSTIETAAVEPDEGRVR
jgi:putative redox protein